MTIALNVSTQQKTVESGSRKQGTITSMNKRTHQNLGTGMRGSPKEEDVMCLSWCHVRRIYNIEGVCLPKKGGE